jgi:hypothetical protein
MLSGYVNKLENILGEKSVVCFDIFATETAATNDVFYSFMLGIDPQKRYIDEIRNFYQYDSENISLLFMKKDNDENYIFIHDSMDGTGEAPENFKLDFLELPGVKFLGKDGRTIDPDKRLEYLERWKKMCLIGFPFSKTIFFLKQEISTTTSIGTIDFVAGLWVLCLTSINEIEKSALTSIEYLMRNTVLEHTLDTLLPTYVEEKIKFEIDSIQFQRLHAEQAHIGHTMYNIFPDALVGVKDSISLIQDRKDSKDKPILEKLDANIKRLDLAKIILLIMGGREIDEFKNKSIFELLHLLKEFETSKRQPALLNFEKNNLLDFVPNTKEKANRAFLILWNFWHNAEKYSDFTEFFVEIVNYENQLAISFKNISKISLTEENCKFLMGKAKHPLPDKGDKGGLTIAFRKMEELGWRVVNATCEEKDNIFVNTIIVLTKK